MLKKSFPLNENERIERQESVLKALCEESDRGSVLVGAAILDDCIEVLIRTYLSSKPHVIKNAILPLFQNLGPMSSFWSKIRFAYAMDLIDEWAFRDLEIIRDIRNAFAHYCKPVDFSNQDIINKTENLVSADRAIPAITAHKTSRISPQPDSSEPCQKFKKERTRFLLSVSHIAGYFEGRIIARNNENSKIKLSER
jgi:DNA-binding MltR family transcriptional regulator